MGPLWHPIVEVDLPFFTGKFSLIPNEPRLIVLRNAEVQRGQYELSANKLARPTDPSSCFVDLRRRSAKANAKELALWGRLWSMRRKMTTPVIRPRSTGIRICE